MFVIQLVELPINTFLSLFLSFSLSLSHNIDCSRPPGLSVNDYAPQFDKQRFQSVDCAAKLVKRGWFMAKVDLKSAYRSVNISAAHSQLVTGLEWCLGGNGAIFMTPSCRLGHGRRQAYSTS